MPAHPELMRLVARAQPRFRTAAEFVEATLREAILTGVIPAGAPLRQEDLAARVSKSRTAITNSVRLLKLDERVQGMILEDRISMGHARALIPVEIPEEQFLLAQEIADRKLSVREVEKLVKKRAAKKPETGEDGPGLSGRDAASAKKKDPALELAYRTIEERLKQSLGTKATIRHGGDGTGKLEIEFYSNDDLEKIVELLTVY